MPRVTSTLALASIALVSLVACSGGEVEVGSTGQQLQTRKDGSPTGDGSTCAWEDPNTSVSSDGSTSPSRTVHDVGDDFKALDGCNDCTCTTRGIMCTVRSCDGGSSRGNPGQPVACDDSAKICPDGTAVGRTGPNCDWAPCPSSSLGQDCSLESPTCPSGESCYVFPNTQGAHCSANPCAVCANPDQCAILESFPAQVKCQ